jgi:acylglycerol lipase
LDQFDKQDTLSISRRELPEDIRLENGYWTNDRGSLMYYTILMPKDKPIKAVLCHCHGYVDTPTYTKRRELSFLAQRGIAVVMVDYEGHGRSDGALGLIMDWNILINDVHTFFLETTKTEFPGTQVFLVGESMGGAVAFSIIKSHPEDYRGVIFMAPMCKIGKDMTPPEWVISLARKIAGPTGTATALGFLPIAPAKGDLKMLTFKLPRKRALISRPPSQFARKPRLATARELLDATQVISNSLGEFNAPFLVQHGTADRVTDPKLSQALYDESKSEDKTIRLYEGMWHSLTAGETDENTELVYNDTIQWILERVEGNKKTN